MRYVRPGETTVRTRQVQADRWRTCVRALARVCMPAVTTTRRGVRGGGSRRSRGCVCVYMHVNRRRLSGNSRAFSRKIAAGLRIPDTRSAAAAAVYRAGPAVGRSAGPEARPSDGPLATVPQQAVRVRIRVSLKRLAPIRRRPFPRSFAHPPPPHRHRYS